MRCWASASRNRRPLDKVAEILDQVFQLKIQKGERTADYTGRAKEIFEKADREGIPCPSVAKGYLILKGSKLADGRRAIVLANARRPFEEADITAALRTSFPQIVHQAGVHVVDTNEPERPNVSDQEIEALLADVDRSPAER